MMPPLFRKKQRLFGRRQLFRPPFGERQLFRRPFDRRGSPLNGRSVLTGSVRSGGAVCFGCHSLRRQQSHSGPWAKRTPIDCKYE